MSGLEGSLLEGTVYRIYNFLYRLLHSKHRRGWGFVAGTAPKYLLPQMGSDFLELSGQLKIVIHPISVENFRLFFSFVQWAVIE